MSLLDLMRRSQCLAETQGRLTPLASLHLEEFAQSIRPINMCDLAQYAAISLSRTGDHIFMSSSIGNEEHEDNN
jgi:hypothetical protein